MSDSTRKGSVLDGLVWMDPKLAKFEMHPGLTEPGGSFPEPAQVPMNERLDLQLVDRHEFESGAVVLRYQPSRGSA